jgi:hypothetical protein
MKNTEPLIMIDGSFNYEEAKEILINIFSSKINFYNIKNWSSQERFGKEDNIAQKRIPELKKEIEKVLQIVSEAKLKRKKLLISSEINISMIDE